MTDDIVTRLRNEFEFYTHAQEAADEIERLRAEKQAFTVKPNDVLVIIGPPGLSRAECEELADIPALKGRVVVISGVEARRGI